MNNRTWIIVIVTLCVSPGFMFTGKNLIRNGNFEKFSGNEPAGWETTNIGKMLTVVSPSSKAHGGDHGVLCEVKTSFGGLMQGMITQKSVPLDGDDFQLSLYYILKSVGRDAGFLAMDFQNEEGSTVGMCQYVLTAASPEFTMFKAVTRKPSGATHCEVRLTMMPEKEGGKLHEGSSLIVDDIELVSLQPEKGGPAL